VQPTARKGQTVSTVFGVKKAVKTAGVLAAFTPGGSRVLMKEAVIATSQCALCDTSGRRIFVGQIWPHQLP
jgi:hypothetical protein